MSTPQSQAVLVQIRRAVVLGELQPGEKLREVALAQALNVSRSTLREALGLLVQDGLLVQEPYRGFSVAQLDVAAVRDVARTRVPLDLIAVSGILEDLSGRRLDLVREAWETYQCMPLDGDPMVQHEAHVAFHRGLWAASENSMLLRLWPITEALSTISMVQEQVTRDDPARARAVHARLVEAILGGDLAVVERELIRHTVDSAEEFLVLRGGRSGGSAQSGSAQNSA